MRKTIIILILLLLPVLCSAGPLQEAQKAVIAKKNVPAGGPNAWYDSTAGTTAFSPSQDVSRAAKVVVTTGGTATKLRVWGGLSEETGYKLALYTSAGNLVSGGSCTGAGTFADPANWNECTINATVTSATTYWVAYDIATGSAQNANYGTDGGVGSYCYESVAYASFPGATITVTGCDDTLVMRMSIYVD